MNCTWLKQLIYRQADKKEPNPLLETVDILRNKLTSDYYYNQRCHELFERYSLIYLYKLEFVGIGETIPRLFTMLEDFKHNKEDVLNVILPVFISGYQGEIYNTYIFRLFGRYLYFIDDTNIDLWRYILKNHIEKIQIKELDKYRERRSITYQIDYKKPMINFTEYEENRGKKRLLEMGIQGEFICLHARGNESKQIFFGNEISRETSVRNSDINTYAKACKYMESFNIQSIRMGRYERTECNILNVIDYSNNFYDEFMDFYLLAKCKFTLGCQSGLTNIAAFLGKPILETNVIILYGYEASPFTKFDMCILKKYYSIKDKRYLNLYEMMDMMNRCNEKTSEYQRLGIRVEDNTEEEIFRAVQEMNMRIDGLWIESEEEKEAQKRYDKIREYWRQNHKIVKYRDRAGFKGYQLCPYRVAWSFLKENMYLIDIDDLNKYNYKIECE